MMRRIKLSLYYICKWLGLFAVASVVTKRGLRILCYHGFALSDESSFRPKLFIKPETFRRRMQHLRKRGYTVLPLEAACESLAASKLPHRAVAITIDDGFYSVFSSAWPVLREHSLPATVYVTSYYAAKKNPIFRLVIQYIFWKTTNRSLELSGTGLPLPSIVPISTDTEKERVCWDIIRYGEEECDEFKRCDIMRELAKRAAVDFTPLYEKRLLSLMTAEEIRQLSRSGIDIQLHTHRHCLPEDEAIVKREITENREFLEPLSQNKLHHLCYPSGAWSPKHWPWLEALDVRTATTCDTGLNYSDTPPLGLKRFLDGENISHIEFEAELSGFSELLRLGRAKLRGV
jgi:peptidoglycan/xylan/chitin deacetylase (PgdA/CDA1 family)